MLTAVPDRRSRSSDGFVVEASIVARLLGIRLLKLDATVVIAPADVTAPPSPLHHSHARTASARALPGRSGAVSGGLADAVQRINEGAAILAEAQRSRRKTRPAAGAGR